MARRHLVLALLLLASAHASAQTSASYRLTEHVVNAGGVPAKGAVHTSASFRVTLDSVGDGLFGTTSVGGTYRVDTGFLRAYAPPGEVFGVRFASRTSLTWNPERSVGRYHVYRDLVGALPGGYGSCLASAPTGNTFTDNADPAAGAAFFYLVTAANRLREEGTKGFRSDGNERSNATPCP